MSQIGILFKIHERLFQKDPQTTPFGQRLMSMSIGMLDDLGFEKFTFKKLAAEMHSSEASIYRYFNNKHMLLLFLSCWYWEWVNYLIEINLKNVSNSEERLRIAIHNIVNASTESPLTEYVNENLLHKVVIKESTKAYHVREVDSENEHGFYLSYADLVNRVKELIADVNPGFPYPRMLASNLFEMANNQIYFAEHLPTITDIKNGKDKYVDLEEAMSIMVFRILAE